MERSGQTLDRVARLFGVLRDNLSTPEIQALDREWQPKLAAADDEITFNPRLFARIEAVYRSLPQSQPDAGAEAARRSDLRPLRPARGAARRRRRRRACRRSTRSWPRCSPISATRCSPTRTPGSCSSAKPISPACRTRCVSAAKAAADERKLAGKWAIVNTRSSVDPFLTFSTRRDLREKVWKKFKSRGDNGDANDTNATIASDREAARRARHAARLSRHTRTGAWPTRWRSTRRRRRR